MQAEYLTTQDAIAFLASNGFPVKPTYFKKIVAPSRNEGPKSAGYFGNRKLYQPEELLRWARGRIRTKHQSAAA